MPSRTCGYPCRRVQNAQAQVLRHDEGGGLPGGDAVGHGDGPLRGVRLAGMGGTGYQGSRPWWLPDLFGSDTHLLAPPGGASALRLPGVAMS